MLKMYKYPLRSFIGFFVVNNSNSNNLYYNKTLIQILSVQPRSWSALGYVLS